MQVQHDKKYSLPNYYFIEENDYSAEKSNNNSQSPPPTTSQPYFQGSASQGSYVESMTPQRMNRIVDWTKNHVTPGDSKNIFPQVIAPSIEFSNDNSVSLNINSMQSSNTAQLRQHLFKKQTAESPQFSGQKKQVIQAQERVMKYAWERQKKHLEQEMQTMRKTVIKHEQEYQQISQQVQDYEDHIQLLQQKHRDYSNLETLRGKLLESSKQQLKQQKQQTLEKDNRINQLENEIHRLQINESHIQEAIQQELTELHQKMQQNQTMVQAVKSQYQDEQHKIQGIKYNHESQLTGAAEQLNNFKQYADQMSVKIKEREMFIQDQDEQIQRMREEFSDLQIRLDQQQQTHQADQNIIKDLKYREEVFLLQNQPGYQNITPQLDNNAYEEIQRECLNYKRQVANLKEQLEENQTFIKQNQKSNTIQSFRLNSPKNQECQACHECKEELASMIQECSLEQEAQNLFNLPLKNLVREITTLLLTKQREQIDMAIEQYEIQQQEMTNQITYFKEQNEEVMSENNRIQDKIQILLKSKEDQETEIFDQFDRLKQQNEVLGFQISTEKAQYKILEQKMRDAPFTVDSNQRQLEQENQNKLQNNHVQQLQEDKKIILQRDGVQKKQIDELKEQVIDIKTKYDQIRKELETSDKQLDQFKDVQKTKDSSYKKQQQSKEKQEKAVQYLIDDKQRLQQKLQDLEQAQGKISDYNTNLKSLEEKCDKTEKSNKEKDKKNIELFGQIKNLQMTLKQLEDQIKFYKEDSEKHQKTITFKNQQIKTLMDQVKGLHDKNNELSQRLVGLSQQINQFEEQLKQGNSCDSQRLDVSPQQEKPHKHLYQNDSPSNILERLRLQCRDNRDQADQLQPAQNSKMIEMYESINNYQKEFQQVKKMLTDRILLQDQQKQSLQQEIDHLQLENSELINTNQLLFQELQSTKIKGSEGERRYNLGSTTLDEVHGRTTQDSMNLRSFLNGRKNLNEDDYSLENGSSQKKMATNIFQHHLQPAQTITELVQPEMLSVEDTIALLREVLRRAVRSVEVVRAVMEISEIKELLNLIVMIEQKMKEAERSDPHFHNKKNRYLSTIILSSNVKSILGSELGRKKQQSTDKINQNISQRSNTGPRGLIDFIDS